MLFISFAVPISASYHTEVLYGRRIAYFVLACGAARRGACPRESIQHGLPSNHVPYLRHLCAQRERGETEPRTYAQNTGQSMVAVLLRNASASRRNVISIIEYCRSPRRGCRAHGIGAIQSQEVATRKCGWLSWLTCLLCRCAACGPGLLGLCTPLHKDESTTKCCSNSLCQVHEVASCECTDSAEIWGYDLAAP